MKTMVKFMKQIIFLGLLIILSSKGYSQEAGNINYQNRVSYSENNINVTIRDNSDLVISIKGLANLKADSYVAIFSLTQVGETTTEVNEKMNQRLNSVINEINKKLDVETFVDMVSFVPVYEYEVEKKIFSKKTYNEIPAGFELKKNLHVKYKNPSFFNELASLCSDAEIYDLIRVDYFSSKLEQTKAELMKKAQTILTEKLATYQTILGKNLSTLEKQLADGYRVVYPVEMYKSYQAYNSHSLNIRRTANVNVANKSTTLYYQPVFDKEFDFVINPSILEPVIQVMYELKLNVNDVKELKEEKVVVENKPCKEYILITPNGDLKTIK